MILSSPAATDTETAPVGRASVDSSATLTMFVPGKLTSRLNGGLSRANRWRIKAWKDEWHERVAMAWMVSDKPTYHGKATVTFTAYVARLHDDDNLPAAIKACRDAAVKLILGTDDGPKSGHTFVYAQEVKPANRGVLITVVPK